jgi:UDP-2-acetamido-2,6-beta-L-arabino-hexul-4-ose reductase
MREAVLQPLSGTVRLEGSPVTVQQLLARLTTLVERYRAGVMPPLSNPFDIKLFNTYRSYLPRESRLIGLNQIKDHRGQLFETIRCDGQGQVFVSTTEPGVTRGNHFHTRKVERFVVCDGNAAVRLRRMLTGEVAEYLVGGEDPVAIDIPTLHTHSITNVGSTPLVTLFWCNEHFSPDDPDTVACEVEVSEVCRP